MQAHEMLAAPKQEFPSRGTLNGAQLQKTPRASRLPGSVGTPNPSSSSSVPCLHHTFALPESYHTKHEAQVQGLLLHIHVAVTLASQGQVGVSPSLLHYVCLGRKRGAYDPARLSVVSTSL